MRRKSNNAKSFRQIYQFIFLPVCISRSVNVQNTILSFSVSDESCGLPTFSDISKSGIYVSINMLIDNIFNYYCIISTIPYVNENVRIKNN